MVYLYLDKRRKTNDGLYPVKIAVSFDRHTDYISTGVYLQVPEFDQLDTRKDLYTIKQKLSGILNKIESYVGNNKHYDILELREFIKTPTPRPSIDILQWFDIKIQELTLEQKWGTKMNYESTRAFVVKNMGQKVPFSKFTKGSILLLKNQITTSPANFNRHMRHIRTIFNMAIDEQVISRDIYPFHKRGYIIQTPRKTRKALKGEDIGVLFSYTPKTFEERRAIDFFTFSFYGNGMNIKDIAYLTKDNIAGNVIRYYRKKSESTSNDQHLIIVPITVEMQHVITTYGTLGKYLFPILKNDHFKDYRNFNRVINVQLRKISKNLGLPPITHGVSRHSFATALKNSNVPTNVISELLGHSSLLVTEHYLSKFSETVLDMSDKLKSYVNGN